MFKFLIAYNIEELKKRKILSEAKNLYKSNIISKEQWLKINEEYSSKLYTPSIFIKILLFIVAYIGMCTVIGPLYLAFSGLDILGYQITSLITGFVFLFITEKILIKDSFHYKSGLTEAGIYAGLSFISFGLLGSGPNMEIVYPLVLFFLSVFATVRYLNLVALLLSVVFFSWILLEIFMNIGGYGEALIPFIFMTSFGLIFFYGKKLETKLNNIIFDDLFTLFKTISLIMFYGSVNYYVVRELSIELMGLSLANGKDIPLAFIFYLLTILIPLGYIYWGVKQRSILFIRIGLLVAALSVITFKYYFSLGAPIITITLSGGILIIISLLFFNYLKKYRFGFTEKKLLHDKWNSQDLAAVIASQTAGGNKFNELENSENIFKEGEFGGGGSGSDW